MLSHIESDPPASPGGTFSCSSYVQVLFFLFITTINFMLRTITISLQLQMVSNLNCHILQTLFIVIVGGCFLVVKMRKITPKRYKKLHVSKIK